MANSVSDPKSVFTAFADALLRGDVPSALEFLHPGIIIHEPAGLPYGGEWEGHEGFTRMCERMNDYWQTIDSSQDGTELYVDGEMLFVVGTLSGTVRATGKHLAIPVMERHQIRDGRIIESWPFYFCTHMVREAGTAR